MIAMTVSVTSMRRGAASPYSDTAAVSWRPMACVVPKSFSAPASVNATPSGLAIAAARSPDSGRNANSSRMSSSASKVQSRA